MIPHAMRVLKMFILSRLEIFKVRTTLGTLWQSSRGPMNYLDCDSDISQKDVQNNLLCNYITQFRDIRVWIEPIESVEAIESVESVESLEAVESLKSIESIKSRESIELLKLL